MTLETDNLLWLRGRAATRKRKSLSEALDEILTAARLGGLGSDTPRSVVGTIDIAPGDPELGAADDEIRALFAESLSRPLLAKESRTAYGARGKARGRS